MDNMPITKKKMKKQQGEATSTDDWSSLPQDLLLNILSRFTNLHDFSSFRKVCRHWNSTSSPPTPQLMSSQSPLILLSRRVGLYRTKTPTLYSLTQNKTHAAPAPHGRHVIGYSHGHVITYTPHHKYYSPSVALLDLFTGKETQLHTHLPRPHRLLLSSHPSSPDFLPVCLSGASLHYWHGPHGWNNKVDIEGLDLVDIVFFRKRLYGITRAAELGVFDDHPLPAKIVMLKSDPIPVLGGNDACFLVESGGDLLLVVMKYSTAKIDGCTIFRWDFGTGGGWAEVGDLAGRAIFVGLVGSTGANSVSVPGVRGDCVYYIEKKHCSWLVYSLEEKRFCESSPTLPGFEDCEPEDMPIWILPSLC